MQKFASVSVGFQGHGMAVSREKGLLALADDISGLVVFYKLPTSCKECRTLKRLFEMGGRRDVEVRDVTGSMAFAGPVLGHVLFVADNTNAVHGLDTQSREYVGQLLPRRHGSIRGIAVHKDLVAVSVSSFINNSGVYVYRCTGTDWDWTRDGGARLEHSIACTEFSFPRGIRFLGDNKIVVTNERGRAFVSFEKGSVPKWSDLKEVTGLWDVEVGVVVDGEDKLYGCKGARGSTVQLVPFVGLVLRLRGGGEVGGDVLEFFATRDTIAMSQMSVFRLAWMSGCVRGIIQRGRRKRKSV